MQSGGARGLELRTAVLLEWKVLTFMHVQKYEFKEYAL